MLIRPARVEDLEQIIDIYNWAVENTTATFESELATAEARLGWFERHKDNFPLIVCVDEGTVLGWASIEEFKDFASCTTCCESAVFVNSEHSGMGIGSKLLDKLVCSARECGYSTIIAKIAEGNQGSEQLYLKHGFEKVGEIKQIGEKFDQKLSLNYYQLLIS